MRKKPFKLNNLTIPQIVKPQKKLAAKPHLALKIIDKF
jgi:hypothetical protein